MQNLDLGDVVHYVTKEGKHLPAIVVNVGKKAEGIFNLQVYPNDGTPHRWIPDCRYSARAEPGTCHLIDPHERRTRG